MCSLPQREETFVTTSNGNAAPMSNEVRKLLSSTDLTHKSMQVEVAISCLGTLVD